jgi:hypothetical protein
MLGQEIVRQDSAAAVLESSTARLQDAVAEFLHLAAGLRPNDGSRNWVVGPTGQIESGWLVDSGTLLLTTDGRLLHFGHMHPGADDGAEPAWHDWNHPCDTGLSDVDELDALPDDLIQLLATTYRQLRNRHQEADIVVLDGVANRFAAIRAVEDPFERLLRAAYFVARERHDRQLARPVSHEDMHVLCPELFPAPIEDPASAYGPEDRREGSAQIGRWWAERARAVLPPTETIVPAVLDPGLFGRTKRRPGEAVQGWTVGLGPEPRRPDPAVIALDGTVYRRHRSGLWSEGELRPADLQRMAELLDLT